MIVYGIKNCDTVKKAINWLAENKIEFHFHDFKTLGITEQKLNTWCELAGWEALLNKRGTTWRKLEPEIQNTVVSQQSAVKLMQVYTSLIKRPVIETNNGILLGFNEKDYQSLLR